MKTKNISERYLSIFEQFYAKRAQERCIHIINYAHEFMGSLKYDAEGYYVDETKIIKSIDSYFLDVIRYKEYHFNATGNLIAGTNEWDNCIHVEKKINNSKVASFTAKWLLRAAPIFVVPKIGENYDDLICHINELFVLNCVLYSLLRSDFSLMDKEDYDKLFYDFKYRAFDDRSYISRFELIEKNIALKKENNSLRASLNLNNNL